MDARTLAKAPIFASAALIGFLYLRFHYIEEGKAIARMQIAATQKPCPAKIERRRR